MVDVGSVTPMSAYCLITSGGTQAHLANLATQLIYPGAHVAWMLRHHNTIVFIQIKHSKLFCRQSSPLIRNQKSRQISDAYFAFLVAIKRKKSQPHREMVRLADLFRDDDYLLKITLGIIEPWCVRSR